MNIFWKNSERKQLEEQMQRAGRLPPGQVATLKWPVLHLGGVPRFNRATWDFRVFGLVEQPLALSYDELLKLPQAEVRADMHCVTRWSRFDNRWEGVPAREIIERARARSEATHVLVHADGGYATNLPLADLWREDVLFAHTHDGQPLAPEHGYPLRLVAPHLYAWKSAKWVRGLEFLDHDVGGLWERNGYHTYGDPWKEQRYDRDP
ncbi:MAG: sulfite oxidase-like oxidoreductase [Candidatus Acidiferrales bacterium]